jgi:hypothetical protein
MRSVLPFALATTLALALSACSRGALPGPEPGPGNAGGTPAADGVCRSDDDCVISCAQPDECCGQLCPPCEQAWHRDALAAHRVWSESACEDVVCPVARCMAPDHDTDAVCRAGACVVVSRRRSTTVTACPAGEADATRVDLACRAPRALASVQPKEPTMSAHRHSVRERVRVDGLRVIAR